MVICPITSQQIDGGKKMETVTDFIRLQNTLAGDCSMKLKDACSGGGAKMAEE